MKKILDLNEKIIVALDVKNRKEAFSLVAKLDQAETFKIGLQLYTAEGPLLLTKIKGMGKKIFLDLKLHDIPNTVSEAVRSGIRHGIDMMTLHASGGQEMMTRASEAAAQEAEKRGRMKPLLLAVTILTSLKEEQLKEIGMAANVLEQVLRLARLARKAGMDGVVSSPQEIEGIKKEFGSELLIVTPGIRPSGAAFHDQKRIMTPAEAIQKGADYLVIGRPITEAPFPQKAYLEIIDELKRTVNPSHSKDRP